MMIQNYMAGFGTVLNIFPKQKNSSLNLPKIMSDAEAIRNDWETIGADMKFALKNFDTSNNP